MKHRQQNAEIHCGRTQLKRKKPEVIMHVVDHNVIKQLFVNLRDCEDPSADGKTFYQQLFISYWAVFRKEIWYCRTQYQHKNMKWSEHRGRFHWPDRPEQNFTKPVRNVHDLQIMQRIPRRQRLLRRLHYRSLPGSDYESETRQTIRLLLRLRNGMKPSFLLE